MESDSRHLSAQTSPAMVALAFLIALALVYAVTSWWLRTPSTQLAGSLQPQIAGRTPGRPRPIEPTVTLGAESEGQAAGELLYRPRGIAIDSNGHVLVVDAGNHRIAVYGPDGEFIRQIGRAGRGPGEFSFTRASPGAIALGAEWMAVLEGVRNQVQVFDTSGTFRDAFGLLSGATTMAALHDGVVLDVPAVTTAEDSLAIHSVMGRVVTTFSPAVVNATSMSYMFLNGSSVATLADDSIVQAYIAWPLLRRFGSDGDLLAERWLDFSWWEDDPRATILRHPRELLRDYGTAQFGDIPEKVKQVVSFDVACGREICAALFAEGIVQGFTPDLTPLRAFEIWTRDSVGSMPRYIAMNALGTRFCAVFDGESVVRCFDVNEW